MFDSSAFLQYLSGKHSRWLSIKALLFNESMASDGGDNNDNSPFPASLHELRKTFFVNFLELIAQVLAIA